MVAMRRPIDNNLQIVNIRYFVLFFLVLDMRGSPNSHDVMDLREVGRDGVDLIGPSFHIEQ
jgi:hypothetical protein